MVVGAAHTAYRENPLPCCYNSKPIPGILLANLESTDGESRAGRLAPRSGLTVDLVSLEIKNAYA